MFYNYTILAIYLIFLKDSDSMYCRDIAIHICCFNIHNRQFMESVYKVITRWRDMENMVHIYNGISFICKEKLNGFIFWKYKQLQVVIFRFTKINITLLLTYGLQNLHIYRKLYIYICISVYVCIHIWHESWKEIGEGMRLIERK